MKEARTCSHFNTHEIYKQISYIKYLSHSSGTLYPPLDHPTHPNAHEHRQSLVTRS